MGRWVGWEEEEEGSLSEVLERLNFGTRFGEGCIGASFSSLLSHLERFREGVEGPAPVASIGTPGWIAEKRTMCADGPRARRGRQSPEVSRRAMSISIVHSSLSS